MRYGITILTDESWSTSRSRWMASEDMGFHHAWTYDHLVWGGLPDSPWRGALPTLAAVGAITHRIGLGTFVASPNFRHPLALLRDIQALDDVAGGRVLLGVGTGGDLDSHLLGGLELSIKDRVDRFQEFTELLVRLRTTDHVTADGRWFSTVDARTSPSISQVPLIVAGNGPRSVKYAARTGDAWVTTGVRAESLDDWFAQLGSAVHIFEEEARRVGRDPGQVPRYLNLDASGRYCMESLQLFTDMAGRAAGLGFTDLVTHWPRAEPPYRGSERVLEQVASEVLTR